MRAASDFAQSQTPSLSSSKTRYRLAAMLSAGLLSMAFALPLTAVAAPTVVVNQPGAQATEQAPTDPQVAPPVASPFNGDTLPKTVHSEQQDAAAQASGTAADTDVLKNPKSLASKMQPSDADLSAANQELLSRNAQLQRDVNDLETRVNVLINERSGQLFMYGAVTVAVSLFLGVLLGGFIFSRRDRW
uniref:SH3 domain protein n=1 Tax=Psychrobacter sp. (strain PRwf-1) TaxID=349106 RepID=A5WGY7_PSYWF